MYKVKDEKGDVYALKVLSKSKVSFASFICCILVFMLVLSNTIQCFEFSITGKNYRSVIYSLEKSERKPIIYLRRQEY